MTIDEVITLLRFNNKHIADLKNNDLQQIAEWLEELKSYRTSVFSGDMTQKMLKEEYCKAIDDFASKLIMHFADWKLSNAPYNDDETDRIREIICETIENAICGVEEIEEQLKAGDGE